MPPDERAQVVLAVVDVVELEHGLAGHLAEPDHGPDFERAGPLELAEHPGRLHARQFSGGRGVQVHGGIRVALQIGGGDLVVDLALDRALDDRGLVLAGCDQDDLAGFENGPDAHGDRLDRDVLGAEEVSGRGPAGDRIERDQACARRGARAGFVETDVPGLPDAQNLEVDAARIVDRALVLAAVGVDLSA